MIETLNSLIATDLRNAYLAKLKDFSERSGCSVAVSYFGVFTQDLIHTLASSTEELMYSNGDDRKTVKRVFSLLIEGLQNIRLHGEKDEHDRQLAFLFLAKNSDYYTVSFGNIILSDDRESLVRYLNRINNMDQKDLKELYIEILSNGFLSKKGGAGLGLLTMRLKSEENIKYVIEELDEHKDLFMVDIVIKRTKS